MSAAAPTAVPTPSSSPAASTAAASHVASPSTAPVDNAWHLVELPHAGDAAQIADVVARSGSVTAASAAGSAGEHPIAWTSHDDGQTWAAEPLPGSSRSIERLVPWGDRLLAVGEGDGDCPHPSVVDVWVRSAKAHWTAAPSDSILCAGGTAEAAADGSRAVIVGTGSGDVAYVWSSEDGLHWTDRSEPFNGLLPQGVAVDGSTFIAAGSGGTASSAWVAGSHDGRTWDGPDPIAGPAGMTIIGGPLFIDHEPVLFAGDLNGAVGVLRPDGHGGWRSEPAVGLDRTTVSRFVSVPGGIVALGGDEQGPAAWASSDGTSWRPVALPAEAVASGTGSTLTGASVADGRAYLVGQITAPAADRATGALWTGGASLLAP